MITSDLAAEDMVFGILSTHEHYVPLQLPKHFIICICDLVSKGLFILAQDLFHKVIVYSTIKMVFRSIVY